MREITLQELLEAGCHFGHMKRRWNPAMTKYIYGERDGVHIFDLAKTKEGLETACEFLKKTAAAGGVILFVGTKRQAADIVKAEAVRAGMPYATVRWMGGLLTNYSHMSKSIQKLGDLKAKKETGEFNKYTKKERLLIDREIARLGKFFGGVTGLTGMPQAVFVVDTHREEVAVREAVRMKIPVVGIVDTNAKPELVDYVIPANDDAVKSIELIVKAAADAVEAGKKQAGKAETQQNKQAKPVSGKEKTAAVKTEAAEAEEVVEEQIDKKVEEELGKEAKEEVLAKVPKGEK
jgi:small subunit ribosomal protein S2